MRNFQEMYDILKTKVNCLAGKKVSKGIAYGYQILVQALFMKPKFLDKEDDEDDTFKFRFYDPEVDQ